MPGWLARHGNSVLVLSSVAAGAVRFVERNPVTRDQRHDFCDLAQALANGSKELNNVLAGSHLSIATGIWDPFYLREEDNGELAGMEALIIEELARTGGFTYDFILHNWSSVTSWGAALVETTPFYDLITFSYWTINLDNTLQGAYSPYSLYDLSLVLASPSAKKETPLEDRLIQFTRPFDWWVWGAIAALTIFTGLLYWILEVRRNEDDFPHEGHLQNSAESCCKAFQVLSGAGGFAPRTSAGKMLLASWAWCAIVIMASYTANLASFLVVEARAQTDFESLREAIRQKTTICMVKGTFSVTWFKTQYPSYSNLEFLADIPGIFAAMQAKQCEAVILGRNEYELAVANPKVDPNCKWKIVGQPLLSQLGGYMMQSDHSHKCTSTARDALQVHFMHMIQEGTLAKIWDQAFRDLGMRVEQDSCATMATQSEPEDEEALSPLTVESMAGVFIMHVACSALALCSLCCKSIHHEGMRAANDRMSRASQSSAPQAIGTPTADGRPADGEHEDKEASPPTFGSEARCVFGFQFQVISALAFLLRMTSTPLLKDLHLQEGSLAAALPPAPSKDAKQRAYVHNVLKDLSEDGEALGYKLQRTLALEDIPSYLPRGDKLAILDSDGVSLTYNQLHEWLKNLDKSALRLDTPGCRVAVCIANGPHLATALLAVSSSCCCAPMDPNSVEAEYERDYQLLNCTAVLVDREDAPAALAAKSLQLPCAVIVPQSASGSFTLKSISGHGATEMRSQTRLSSPKETVLVLCTSGTTGNKKVVPYTMETIVVGAACIVKSWALSERDRCLNMMPLMHVGGILRNLIAVLFSEGSVICCPFFDQQLFWSCLVSLDATWYYASPTMHRGILEEASIRRSDGLPMENSLRMVCNAAGGLPAKVAKELREVFHCAVLPSYGMTECMPISSPPPDFSEDAPTTSGLACGPEMQIVDSETGQPLPPNQVGNIVVRGPPVMGGYENNHEATKESFWPAGGWFCTGDLGYMNEDGWLFVTGRAKEVIKRGGETISPAEIEDAIVKHPDIKMAAAFAIGDVTLEENVALAIVMRDPNRRVGLPSLHEFLQSELRPSCWPQALLYVEAIPKTSTGKVRRAWLSKACAGSVNKISSDGPWRERLFEATTTGCVSADAIKVSHVSISTTLTTTALSSLLGEACTVHLSSGRQPLVTYTTSSSLEMNEVKEAASTLHEYERPDAVVSMDVLKEPWPEPKPAEYLNAGKYVAPKTEEEIAVCKIWSSILGCPENGISVEADFFQMGGSSLLCGRVAANLRAAFNCTLPMQVVFVNPKLEDLARAVAEARAAECCSGTSTTGSTPSESDAEDEQLHTPEKSCFWNYSSTNPVVMIVQLIPFFLFPTIFHMTRFLTFIWFYHFMRSNNILQPLANFISNYFFAHTFPEFMICWYIAMCLMPWIVAVFLPVLGIVLKWAILGRVKPGKYPLWGGMYLRWWLMRRTCQFCRPGIFEQSDWLFAFYLRCMGAKIHPTALVSSRISDHFFEGDLLTVDENAVLCDAHIACGIVDGGFLILDKVTVRKNCSVGSGTILAPGTALPEGTCLGPGTSSYSVREDHDDSMRRFNDIGFTKPSKFSKYLLGVPLVFLVHLISNIPYLMVVYYMVHFRPGSLTWSAAHDHWLRQAIHALTYPERMVLWCCAIVAHNCVCPLIHAALLILIKRCIVGKFVARRKEDETDWDKLKMWIIGRLASQKFMIHFSRLVGPHWNCMTWFYRSMGMKCGDRIFWPGTPIDISQFDLVEIGNDVVFGSRSIMRCEDRDGYSPIKVKDGAMVADRCQLLPGVTLGKNAMLGSGTVGHKDASFPDNSVWVGNHKNAAVLLSQNHGGSNGDTTLRPFGQAYGQGKTSYCLLPWPAFTALCIVVQALTCWWQPPHGWVTFLVIVVLKVQWTSVWELLAYLYLAYFCLFAVIQIFSLALDIFSKWIVIGRRRPGTYNWTDSSYNQRWKLHLMIQHALHRTTHKEPYMELLGGSQWMVLYFRCLGAKIGKNVCLYHNGGWPKMTEPDLVTIGDGAAIGFCSLICHSNSQGQFEMNPIVVGDYCTLRDRTRLAGGGSMASGSTLLEHTLVMPGEMVQPGTYWQGWPAIRQGPSKTWV